MPKTRIFFITLTAFFLLIMAGCGDSRPAEPKTAGKTIKVGVTAGPQAVILEAAKKVLAKDGIDMQIVEFNDFAVPNVALNDGDLDANSFQHGPFLEAQMKDRKFDLVPLGKTVILPMGLYSKKITKLADLAKEGATVAIPNDPSNGGRALLLLQKQGLLKLDPAAGILPGKADIKENPQKLDIKEIEAAQAPRALDDVDLVAVNTNYALVAGLSPTKNSLAMEDKESPYACLIVARTKDKDREDLKKLVAAYQSPEVAKFIEEAFGGSIVKAW